MEFVGGNVGKITTRFGAILVDDNVVHHVDATSFAAMDQLAQTTAQTFADPVERRAAFAQSAGENAASIWGQLVGGAFRSDASGTAGGYYGLHTGSIFDTDVSADRGWVAGLQAGRVIADDGETLEITQTGVTVGHYQERGNITYQLGVGLAYNDADREIAVLAGLEGASSGYWSRTVSPAISFDGLFGPTNTVRLRYTGVFADVHDFVTSPTLQVGARRSIPPLKNPAYGKRALRNEHIDFIAKHSRSALDKRPRVTICALVLRPKSVVTKTPLIASCVAANLRHREQKPPSPSKTLNRTTHMGLQPLNASTKMVKSRDAGSMTRCRDRMMIRLMTEKYW